MLILEKKKKQLMMIYRSKKSVANRVDDPARFL